MIYIHLLTEIGGERLRVLNLREIKKKFKK